MYYLEEVGVVDRTNEGGKILDILRRFRAEVSDVLGIHLLICCYLAPIQGEIFLNFRMWMF